MVSVPPALARLSLPVANMAVRSVALLNVGDAVFGAEAWSPGRHHFRGLVEKSWFAQPISGFIRSSDQCPQLQKRKLAILQRSPSGPRFWGDCSDSQLANRKSVRNIC